MDWYKFNIGDYQRATEDLTPFEHWAYRALIDQYYLRSGALPSDVTTLCRMVGATHPVHRKAICSVITRYFQKNGDGKLHNTRCDEEIEEYQRLQAAARTAALARHAHGTHAPRTAERNKEIKKEGKAEDKPTSTPPPNPTTDGCKHRNPDGSFCGKPGSHKVHPASKDWYCSEHQDG